MKSAKSSTKAKAKSAGGSKKKTSRTAAKKSTIGGSKSRSMSMMDSDDRLGSRSSVMKDQSQRRMNAAGKNREDIDDEDISPNRRAMTMAGKGPHARRSRSTSR